MFKYQRMIMANEAWLKNPSNQRLTSFLRNNLKNMWFHLLVNILVLSKHLLSLPQLFSN